MRKLTVAAIWFDPKNWNGRDVHRPDRAAVWRLDRSR